MVLTVLFVGTSGVEREYKGCNCAGDDSTWYFYLVVLLIGKEMDSLNGGREGLVNSN